MNKYPNLIKEKLMSLIAGMSASLTMFVKNPEKDFTRNRKLSFETVVKMLICMGGNSIYQEFLESQSYDVNTATTSAFVQQRDKILPTAFEHLLHEFTASHSDIKKYCGYRLLAVDGSDLHIATDPNDTDTYFQNKPGAKGYNLLHLNAMYDLCNRLYVDSVVQPRLCLNEHKALSDMVERSRIEDKVIITADRGYESYNNFAHIEQKGWNYVVRVKDLGSNGILSGLNLPTSEEFDVCVKRILTKKQTNEVKSHPEIYRFMPKKSSFDYFDSDNKFYTMSFRIVRIKLPNGSYETLITNLDTAEFPPAKLKKIYKMRWGIETSFRELKYTIGLINFHAKKQAYIIQEIFARIIMYNFTEMITTHVVISQADKKHDYQVNFAVAARICRHFLRLYFNAPPPNVAALIRKNILPIRPNRNEKRNIRTKTAVSFVYRVA